MARIEQLEIRNYKVLGDIKLDSLGQFAAFLGPNGCGKSTLFDAFSFLAQCLETSVSDALKRRGSFEEVRSREKTGAIVFVIQYREQEGSPLMSYELHIDVRDRRPLVAEEKLISESFPDTPLFSFKDGKGSAARGAIMLNPKFPDDIEFNRLDELGLKFLSNLTTNPHYIELHKMISGWRLLDFFPKRTHEVSYSGYAEHLSREGDNYLNYIRYLHDQHPEVYKRVLKRLNALVPSLEFVKVLPLDEGSFTVQFKDRSFKSPIEAQFMSDGTLKIFAYLALLNDPEPPSLLCIEEPENGLHPQLLQILIEEFRWYSEKTQIFMSSHSPYLVNFVKPEELWLMNRNQNGYAEIIRSSETLGVKEFLEEGLTLGELWVSNHLGGGTL